MTFNRNGVDQGAISKRTVTAKGNLLAGTANSVVSNLAVGNDGETLVADSSQATGLRYQGSMAAARNAAIGGGFDIWQRGTSFTSFPATNTYTADRWQAYRGAFAAGMTITRQSTNDTTNLPFIQYCARVSRDSGNTSTQTLNLQTSIESANTYPLTGRTFVLSFYARAGANYSAASSVLSASVASSTSADINYTSMPTTAATTNVTLTTTWQRFSVSGTFGATAISAGIGFVFVPVGTAGANDYFEVTGVQLELGSVATTFSRAGGTIQGELGACQRYYWRAGGDSTYQAYGGGIASSTTAGQVFVNNPINMRIAPTSIDFSTLNMTDALANYAITNLTIAMAGKNGSLLATTVASGQTSSRFYMLTSNNSVSGYIGFSAEL